MGTLKKVLRVLIFPFVWVWFTCKWVNQNPKVSLIRKENLPLEILYDDIDRLSIFEIFMDVQILCSKRLFGFYGVNSPELSKKRHRVVEIVWEEFTGKTIGKAYTNIGADGKPLPFSTYRIGLKKGLSGEELKCAVAHEIGHILGHWHHGTCFLMQPTIPWMLGYDYLLKGFKKWMIENYGGV